MVSRLVRVRLRHGRWARDCLESRSRAPLAVHSVFWSVVEDAATRAFILDLAQSPFGV